MIRFLNPTECLLLKLGDTELYNSYMNHPSRRSNAVFYDEWPGFAFTDSNFDGQFVGYDTTLGRVVGLVTHSREDKSVRLYLMGERCVPRMFFKTREYFQEQVDSPDDILTNEHLFLA